MTDPALETHPEGLRLVGTLAFADAARTWHDATAGVGAAQKGQTFNFDLSGLESVDGGTMALLVHLRAELKLRGVASEFIGAPEAVQRIIKLYGGDVLPAKLRRPRPQSMLAQVGAATVRVVEEARGVLGFLGDMVLASLGTLGEPRTGNWKEVPRLVETSGADAVPIVVLINFLIGFVMGFQSAAQLAQFGANIWVADLVGLSMTRELGPLMTAIIVCGRSGAAFAAELGSMKVSEEIDALRTMGFGPLRYLVLPRTLALIIILPALTLLGDLVGILGGLLVGVLSLDVGFQAYIQETLRGVKLWDVFSGLIKSVFFGLAIALVACQQGFATTGGAEGVGRKTTSAVVITLFSLILLDALFTIAFHVSLP